MTPISLSLLTVCGIEELPHHREGAVTHVLSLLDPDWPELEAFHDFKPHERTTMHFHDIIEPLPGKTMPTERDVAAVLKFGEDLKDSLGAGQKGHVLVHCHMGVSRSTAAMLTLLAQAHPEEAEHKLFARLRGIRPQAWPNSVMVGYADKLLARDGRLVEALREHYSHRIADDPEVVEWMTRLGRRREVEMAA